MGFSSKGLGMLLVFFPDDDYSDDKYIDKRKKLSSPSYFKGFRRSNSYLLMNRAQSTISICAIFVIFTLLLFTLCTFEPTSPTPKPKIQSRFPRRWLSDNSNSSNNKDTSSTNTGSWYLNLWRKGVNYNNSKNKEFKNNRRSVSSTSALQGLGTLFRRGTKAMNDLIVAHLVEDVKFDDLRLFMRSLHRSGLAAKSDLVFIFPSSKKILSSNFSALIQEENESFLKLVYHSDSVSKSTTGLNMTHFVGKKKEKQRGEPLWGRKIHGNYSNQEGEGVENEFTELNFGSVVSFEATELDPEGSLTGFFDNVSMSFRRWACYPMLLGRVRRNFKHLMLVDIKDVVVLGDSLARVRNRSPESVILSAMETAHGKHHRKNSEKTQTHTQKELKPINPAVIVGGMRGIRRLSNAMLTEIARASIHSKSKTPISESAIFNKLVQNESLLKTINIITTTDSIPDSSSMAS